jgi:nucleoside-diphosphate-sugar epimerase
MPGACAVMVEHLNQEPRAPERAVVMGAGGFVGGAITRRLVADGVPTLALTRRELDLLAADAATRLKALLRPTDCLVMVSAVAPARTIATLAPNVRMAEVVCEALAGTPVAQVVYISSDAVYADTAGPFTEESCSAPGTLHGAMHVLREVMLQSSVTGPLTILRPTLLYGAGDPHNSYGPNRFRRLAALGEPITLFGGGEEKRDHVFVEDVGRLTALVVHHKSHGVLNVATGVSTSFRRVAEIVVSLAPRPVPVVTTERQTPVTHRYFDVTACLKAFPGFRYMTLAEGLRQASQAA